MQPTDDSDSDGEEVVLRLRTPNDPPVERDENGDGPIGRMLRRYMPPPNLSPEMIAMLRECGRGVYNPPNDQPEPEEHKTA